MKNTSEIPATDEQLDKVLSNNHVWWFFYRKICPRINRSDMYLYPDLDTMGGLPAGDEDGSVAGLICDVYDRESHLQESTWQLETCSSSYGKTWFKSFNLGPEPEFFTLQELDWNGRPIEVNDKGSYFDLAQQTLQITLVVKSSMSWPRWALVEASHHEVAVGQHEIDFKIRRSASRLWQRSNL